MKVGCEVAAPTQCCLPFVELSRCYSVARLMSPVLVDPPHRQFKSDSHPDPGRYPNRESHLETKLTSHIIECPPINLYH